MIEIKNLSKRFKGLTLFENVSVTIPTGCKVFVKGENGTGKSVLLKLLVGYSKATKGTIIIDGKILGEDLDFILDAGISINAPEFLPYLTGYENLEYLLNINKIATMDQAVDLAQQLNFDKDLHKKYKKYSLGMKQKMRFIQAVIEKPTYLILDEPFDALDTKSREFVIEHLQSYTEDSSRTLIYTSHNSQISTLSDFVLEISNHSVRFYASNGNDSNDPIH